MFFCNRLIPRPVIFWGIMSIQWLLLPWFRDGLQTSYGLRKTKDPLLGQICIICKINLKNSGMVRGGRSLASSNRQKSEAWHRQMVLRLTQIGGYFYNTPLKYTTMNISPPLFFEMRGFGFHKYTEDIFQLVAIKVFFDFILTISAKCSHGIVGNLHFNQNTRER